MRANSSRVSATPAPNTKARICRGRPAGVKPNVSSPVVTMMITPKTMWWMCVPPGVMSWNHHDTCARISRVLARTARKVTSRPTVKPSRTARASPTSGSPKALAAKAVAAKAWSANSTGSSPCRQALPLFRAEAFVAPGAKAVRHSGAAATRRNRVVPRGPTSYAAPGARQGRGRGGGGTRSAPRRAGRCHLRAPQRVTP